MSGCASSSTDCRPTELSIRNQQCGAHDAGFVLELGRDDLGSEMEVVEELVGLPRHASPDDDEIWPQQGFDPLQVLVDRGTPLLPRLVAFLANSCARVILRVAAVDLDVPQLGVRNQDAVVEHCTS